MKSSAVLTILFSFAAGTFSSSTSEAVAGPGPDQIGKALDFEKTLRGLEDSKPHGMIMVAGPASKESEGNFFKALFRHKRHHKIHHHRRRIHHHPIEFIAPHGFKSEQHAENPTALLEVMKIRERVVVDEQNRPKGAELALTNDLMQVDPQSGQVKMLRHGELRITPKKPLINNSVPEIAEKVIERPLVKSVGPERTFVMTEFGADGNPIKMPQQGSRIDRFIRYMHLDQFWPLFLFSAVCGFTFVGLTFLAAKLILGLIDDNERDSYEAVPTDENLLDSIESAQPIKITNEMIEINERSSLNQDKTESEDV